MMSPLHVAVEADFVTSVVVVLLCTTVATTDVLRP